MPTKEFAIQLLVLIMGMVTYSVMAFAYMHSNFSSKELLEMMIDRTNRIELKIDHLIERGN